MYQDVYIKIKKKNQIIFSKNSLSLEPIISLMKELPHRALVLWAFDCANLTLKDFSDSYPFELRPQVCLKKCKLWAEGKIKMKEAKKAILDCHGVAKIINDEVNKARCHAIGHAGATVHVGTHAIGLPMYELTAIVLNCGKKNFEDKVNQKINYYIDRLKYWQNNYDHKDYLWANFLLK